MGLQGIATRSLDATGCSECDAVLSRVVSSGDPHQARADEEVCSDAEGGIENIVTFCTHRITNGVAVGMNSKIMSIKRRVGG